MYSMVHVDNLCLQEDSQSRSLRCSFALKSSHLRQLPDSRVVNASKVSGNHRKIPVGKRDNGHNVKARSPLSIPKKTNWFFFQYRQQAWQSRYECHQQIQNPCEDSTAGKSHCFQRCHRKLYILRCEVLNEDWSYFVQSSAHRCLAHTDYWMHACRGLIRAIGEVK